MASGRQRRGASRALPVGAGEIGSRLAQSGDVGTVVVSTRELDSGALTLRDASLRKRGESLLGAATATQADLRAALPFLEDVQPIASGDGALVMRGTASLLGSDASVDVTVAAQGGDLVVAPNVPFGGLATITLFGDPHVRVQSIVATPVPGGFRVSAVAQLH